MNRVGRIIRAGVLFGGLFFTTVYLHSEEAGKTVLIEQEPGEAGYFLTCPQKLELITTGFIRDDQGRLYNIFIVPGYGNLGNNLCYWVKEGGDDYLDYFRAKPYKGIWKGLKSSKEGYKNVVVDFMGKDLAEDWKDNFSKANTARKKQVFGWWLAYPWSTIKCTTFSAFRLVGGTVATGCITVYGLALRPAYEIVKPPITGSWKLAVRGALVQGSGMVWNTVIAPPMALLGQKPNPDRVDGFWVRSPLSAQTVEEEKIQLSEEMLDLIIKYELSNIRYKRDNIQVEKEYQPKRQYLIDQLEALNEWKKQELNYNQYFIESVKIGNKIPTQLFRKSSSKECKEIIEKLLTSAVTGEIDQELRAELIARLENNWGNLISGSYEAVPAVRQNTKESLGYTHPAKEVMDGLGLSEPKDNGKIIK